MDKKLKWIIVSAVIIIVAYILYRLKTKPTIVMSNKDISDRLRQMELTNKDVSGLDAEFLKKWLESAEYFLTHGGGGGLPGWEYGKKFNYKGKDYFIKGGTTKDPDAEV